MIVLSHTAHTGYSMQVLERARAAGAAVVHISGIGNGGDVETVAPEESYAYTASHTGALLRIAQIAVALGARSSWTPSPTPWRASSAGPAR